MKTTDTTTERETLEIERTVPLHARRVTVEDHLRWKTTGRPPHADDADLEELIRELRAVERGHPR